MLGIGDLNNDGILDLGVASGGGFVSVLLGNGDGTFQPAVYFGTNANPLYGNAAVAAADFNEDGRLDLITVSRFGDSSVLLSITPF